MSVPIAPDVLETLRRAQPRSHFLRWSIAIAALLIAWAWGSALFEWRALDIGARREQWLRFVGELVPFELRDGAFTWSAYGAWITERWQNGAGAATANTFAMATVAIVLAMLAGISASLLATRALITAEPYLPSSRVPAPAVRWLWSAVCHTTRGLMLFARAIPEYVLAFLAVALFGPLAWALILALAVHNAGILGRLGAEFFESERRAAPRALRASGATRVHIAAAALFPASCTRLWVLFFYRFETCIREATVLGMVGVSSLGYGIASARARLFYDEMIFLIACSAMLVLAGDLFSTWIRERLRAAERDADR